MRKETEKEGGREGERVGKDAIRYKGGEGPYHRLLKWDGGCGHLVKGTVDENEMYHSRVAHREGGQSQGVAMATPQHNKPHLLPIQPKP